MPSKVMRTPRPALEGKPRSGRLDPVQPEASGRVAKRADRVAAGAAAARFLPKATATRRAIKKVLIYMSTSTPELLDLARSAQQSIREALRRIKDEDAQSKDRPQHFGEEGDRGVEILGLVHGYQPEGRVEIGASRFEIRLDGELQGPLVRPTTLGFVPGDETMVAEWVREALEDAESDVAELDSTMLVFWGHGAGVATTLSLPRRLHDGMTGLLNIGGLKDGVLARKLCETMPGTRPPGRFDLLVFDSCLMAGAELAFEYRGLARYAVASQTLVETAPGGPPGLNLGEVIAAFLKESAWAHEAEPASDASAVQARARTARKPGDLLDSATQIAELVGDGRSGAQQLTVFDLDDTLSDQLPAPTWLAAAEEWLEKHRLERESDDLRAHIRRLTTSKEIALARNVKPMIVRAAEELEELRPNLGLAGLLWLFTRLLSESSFDGGEKERILSAFRGANFRAVRQFLDLCDLARQVHQRSHNRLLQLVALALMAELTPNKGSFVVAHRLAAPLREKARLSGVSIYCPWFRAQGTADARRAFDVVVDHGSYRALDLPHITGWADFVFGPLFEATSTERQPVPGARASEPLLCSASAAGFARVRLVASACGCRCGCGCGCGYGGKAIDHGASDGARGVLNGDKPSGHALGEGKPSGHSLNDGKPSGHALIDGKPSGHSLGPDSFD